MVSIFMAVTWRIVMKLQPHLASAEGHSWFSDIILPPALLIDTLFCLGMSIALAEPIYNAIIYIATLTWEGLFV